MVATYEQLSGLIQSSENAGQIAGAVIAVAEAIRNEDAGTANHANRVKWASRAWSSPSQVANEMRGAIYSRYADIALGTGLTMTDEQARTAVADAVDVFADGS